MNELPSSSFEDTYSDEIITLTYGQLTKAGLSRKLAKTITKLPKEPYVSFLKIVNDDGLLVMINDVYNNGNRVVSAELFRLYQTIITNTFDILIDSMILNVENFGSSMYEKICWRLSSIREPISLSILKGIYDATIFSLDTTEKNIVVESPKNVQISRDIESLNLTNYPLLLQYFSEFNHYNKQSSSESIVFSAVFKPKRNLNNLKAINTLGERQVYFKIFPIGNLLNTDRDSIQYDTTGLETETGIYEQLGKLVEFGVTPNILCNIWGGKIDRFNIDFINSPNLSAEFKEACLNDVVKINRVNLALEPNKVWTDTGIIITLSGGNTLYDVIGGLTPAERKGVMFQIIYTLYVFEKLEISHGDLHAGNIFVQNIVPTTLNFIIQDRHYRITTTKLVKIYDFDHSTICKTTDIKLNRNDTFTINALLNVNRSENRDLNTMYAETNIFNKQLDFSILFTFGLMPKDNDDNLLNLIYFEGTDPEFTEFIRYCMPGFYSKNGISDETIGDTYIRLLQNPANLLEASRLFNYEITDINTETLIDLGISTNILEAPWTEYFLSINTYYGRIIKDLDKTINNHLWIPDEIIIPKINMLTSPYFGEYFTEEPINVKKGTVYSIDNRIII